MVEPYTSTARPARRPVAAGGARYARALLPSLLALLISAAFLWAAPLNDRMSFSLGGVGAPLTQGFNLAETTPDGRGFRWTDGDSVLRLPAQGVGAHVLRFRASAPWPSAPGPIRTTVSLNGQPLMQIDVGEQARTYALAIPASQVRWGRNEVRFESPTFAPDEVNKSERKLGIAMFEASWASEGAPPWMVPLQVALIALAVGLLAALLAAHQAPPWAQALSAGLLLCILLAMRHSDMRFVNRWHALGFTLAACAALGLALAARRRWGAGDAGRAASLRDWASEHWRAMAGYLAVSAVMLLPLVLHFTTHIMGAAGDNWEYLWKMQWYSEALLQRHTSPTYVPQLFFPNGAELTSSEISAAQHMLYIPLTLIFGPTVSYNINLLLTFALSGFFTYLLARRLGARAGAAFVAGLIYAFSVRRFFHATGHFGISASQWAPLLLYAWEGMLTWRRTWDGWLAATAYVLATWSSMIYGVTTPLLVVGYTLVRVGPRGLLATLREVWQPLALMAALSVALILPALQPYFEAQAEGLTYQHQYAQLALHAVKPINYILPNPLHPLWGAWATSLYPPDGGEHYASPGYSVIALALAGLWLGRKQRPTLALGAMLLVFGVLSLGPDLKLGESISIPLPAKLLYELPGFSSIRTWGRMELYVMLCAGVLASVALERLAQRLRGARWHAAWAVAGALVLAESASVIPLSEVQARPVDVWLRDQPGDGSVVDLPHKVGGPTEFLTMIYADKPVSQGNGTFTPAAFREGQDIYYRFPDESSLRLMQRWQVDYLVIDHAKMAEQHADWQATLEALGLVTKVYDQGGFSVYRLAR